MTNPAGESNGSALPQDRKQAADILETNNPSTGQIRSLAQW